MKIVSTPFSFRGSGYLGKVYRPYLQALFTSSRIDEWIPIEVVVDTGADYTLLPKKDAELLRISLKSDCFVESTRGVGGVEKVYLCRNKVRVKISTWERIIPVGFLAKDDVPVLLGRLQCLEVVSLIMKNHITILEK